MGILLKHRNSQKRIYFEDAVYFITVKTYESFPYFRESIFCDLFVENLRICKQLKQFKLYGWVLIYDHFHLLVQPGDRWNISDVMFSIKKQFSHNVNWVMGFNQIPFHPEGGQALVRLQVIGLLHHNENWPYVKKFDEYVRGLKHLFQQKFKNNHSYPKFKWQQSFRDHYIRNETDFQNHIDYIFYNPQKHGLPNGWPYIFTNPKYQYLTDDY